MVAVVVKKSASPKESSDGLVEYVLEDAWGKVWTFRAESSESSYQIRDYRKIRRNWNSQVF